METTDRWGSTRYTEVFYVGRTTFRVIAAVVGDGVPRLLEGTSSPTAPFASRPMQKASGAPSNSKRPRKRPTLLVPVVTFASLAFTAGVLVTTAVIDARAGRRLLDTGSLPSSTDQVPGASGNLASAPLVAPPDERAPSTDDVALGGDSRAEVVSETKPDTVETDLVDESSLLLEVDPNPEPLIPEAVAPARSASARVSGTLRPAAAPPEPRIRRRAAMDKASDQGSAAIPGAPKPDVNPAAAEPDPRSWVDPWAE